MFKNNGNYYSGIKLKEEFFQELKNKYEKKFIKSVKENLDLSNVKNIYINVAIAHHNSVVQFNIYEKIENGIKPIRYTHEQYKKIGEDTGLYVGHYCGCFGIYLHEQKFDTIDLVLSRINEKILEY